SGASCSRRRRPSSATLRVSRRFSMRCRPFCTAWEFRHPSWLCPDVLELLVSRSAAPVVVESQDTATSTELMPGGALSERWGFPFVYVRFRREHYTYADLCVWGEILGDVIGEG